MIFRHGGVLIHVFGQRTRRGHGRAGAIIPRLPECVAEILTRCGHLSPPAQDGAHHGRQGGAAEALGARATGREWCSAHRGIWHDHP